MSRIFLVSLIFIGNLFACSTYWIPTFVKEADYNFIDERFLGDDAKNPLYKYAHISPWAYDTRVSFYQKIKKELNLKEWSNYLNISKKDALDIVYHDKKPIMIKDKLKRDEFIRYKNALNNIQEYDTEWKKVLQVFNELYKESKLKFFKTRIAYNIIKAYHNLEMYDKEIEFINSLEKTDSIVWEWIESFKAGALQHKGDFVTSAYLFAKVFATHKSDRYIGYYDFKILSDDEWSELLLKANDSEEQTLFHFLRAINPKNNELAELITMTQIDKNSKWTKRLFYLVAQKAQYRMYLLKYKLYDEYDFKKEDLIGYVERFITYLEKNQNSYNRYMLGYFSYIYRGKSIDIDDKKYKTLLEYLKFIDNLKRVDEKLVSKRLLECEKLFKGSSIINSLKKYTMNKLSLLYPKDSLKAKLSGYYEEYDRYFSGFDFRSGLYEVEDLQNYLHIKNKKNKDYIEKLMLSSDEIKLSKNTINLYYGILYTKRGDFQKALRYIKKLPPSPNYDSVDDTYYWENKGLVRVSRYNPFNVTFSGDNRKYPYIRYSHKKFLETVIKIKQVLKKNSHSTTDNFLMGNAWYNLSDFGNSPMFATIYRCTTCIEPDAKYMLQKAKGYYQMALSYSNGDKELRAKVWYQLMKISMAEEILKKAEKDGYYPKPAFEDMGSIFELLEKNSDYERFYKTFSQRYKDTKFYKKVKGCASFRYFSK